MNENIRCRIIKHDIPLDKPFSYFLGTLSSLPYSKVELQDADGRLGVGEICHAIDINGELQENALAYAPYVEKTLRGFSRVTSVSMVEEILSQLRLLIAHNTGLLCGVEQALFSLLAQETNCTLLEALCLTGDQVQHDTIHIQSTISYLAPAEYVPAIDTLMLDHRPGHVKFKVGKDSKAELAAIAYLRSKSDEVSISVDANQAFSGVEYAIAFSRELRKHNVAWAEQLLHKDNIRGLRKLVQATALPMMIDEGLHTPLEAEFYAKEKLAKYFNIKLAKTGGILKAREIIEIASSYGIDTMLGSMLHGKLGLEYNLAFGFTQSFMTHDFFSSFNIIETRNLEYVQPNMSVSKEIFLKPVL